MLTWIRFNFQPPLFHGNDNDFSGHGGNGGVSPTGGNTFNESSFEKGFQGYD